MSSLELIRPGTANLRRTLRCTLSAPHQPVGELERQVTAFIEYARALHLDLGQHWLLSRGGMPVCGVTCLESPGRTAMLFLPSHACTGDYQAAVLTLLEDICKEEVERGVRLLQVLLEPHDAAGVRLLELAGFQQIAVLDYLECFIAQRTAGGLSEALPAAPASSAWKRYDDGSHRQFADLIRSTYEGSRDCPVLGALRAIDDVIAGHRAAGLFAPHRWRLLCVDDQAAGCVLLSQNPLRPVLELVYMGVAPAFRGRGIGRHILNAGLQIAREDGFASVTLAVDRDNEPAKRLYASTGFSQSNSRRAMLRVIASG